MSEETILVVDSVDLVLRTVVAILKGSGFNVLQADSGAHAIEIANNYPGKIDLLLSDTQMMDMTGCDLGNSIKKTRPEIHLLFMSGFSLGDLLALKHGWSFIQKPHLPITLLAMVNSCLI